MFMYGISKEKSDNFFFDQFQLTSKKHKKQTRQA